VRCRFDSSIKATTIQTEICNANTISTNGDEQITMENIKKARTCPFPKVIII
jgi:hypothetical protein